MQLQQEDVIVDWSGFKHFSVSDSSYIKYKVIEILGSAEKWQDVRAQI